MHSLAGRREHLVRWPPASRWVITGAARSTAPRSVKLAASFQRIQLFQSRRSLGSKCRTTPSSSTQVLLICVDPGCGCGCRRVHVFLRISTHNQGYTRAANPSYPQSCAHTPAVRHTHTHTAAGVEPRRPWPPKNVAIFQGGLAHPNKKTHHGNLVVPQPGAGLGGVSARSGTTILQRGD